MPLYFCPVVSSSIHLSFFPRLILPSQIGWLPYLQTWCGLSANLGCRSETCCTRLAENAGRKKSPKIRHLDTIAQICRALSSQLRHASTIGKKLLKQQYLPHMSLQYGALPCSSGWDHFVNLGHPSEFQRVSRLAALLHGTLVVSVSQTLRRWTEGATYIRTAALAHILVITRLHRYTRPIVTDRIAWYVCLSVGLSVSHSREPCKTDEPIQMPFGLWAQVGSRNHALDGVQIPYGKE